MTTSSVTVHLASLDDLAELPARLSASLPATELATIADRVHMGHRRSTEASVVLAHIVLGPTARVNASTGPPVPGQASLSVSHDRAFVAVAASDSVCGVDVEDHPPSDLDEVADRFCSTAELAGPTSARGLWAAKESASKAVGHGLRAGFRSISFDGDPATRWSAVRWGHGAGFLTRCVDAGARHFALTVRASRPPAVSVRLWSPVHDDRRWWLAPTVRPHGTLTAVADRLSDMDGTDV